MCSVFVLPEMLGHMQGEWSICFKTVELFFSSYWRLFLCHITSKNMVIGSTASESVFPSPGSSKNRLILWYKFLTTLLSPKVCAILRIKSIVISYFLCLILYGCSINAKKRWRPTKSQKLWLRISDQELKFIPQLNMGTHLAWCWFIPIPFHWSPGNKKFTIGFSGFTVDDAGKWLIDPLKQTEIGQIILAGNLIGNLPRIKAYASDFLHMVPNSCRHDDFHEVILSGIYLSRFCNK